MKVDGVIAISGGELSRFAMFYDSVLHLIAPPNTAALVAKGANIAENRNGLAERAIGMGAEWILYLDDDQVLAPNTLAELLERDKDVISGLYVSRQPPFIPMVYDREDERGFCFPRLLETFDGGIHSVVATGAGCLLVKTKVLRALEKPYWRLGQITKDGWGDDLHFCRRVRELGFEIWVDLNVLVGHHTVGVLWPARQADGSWVTTFIQGSHVEPTSIWPAAKITL